MSGQGRRDVGVLLDAMLCYVGKGDYLCPLAPEGQPHKAFFYRKHTSDWGFEFECELSEAHTADEVVKQVLPDEYYRALGLPEPVCSKPPFSWTEFWEGELDEAALQIGQLWASVEPPTERNPVGRYLAGRHLDLGTWESAPVGFLPRAELERHRLASVFYGFRNSDFPGYIAWGFTPWGVPEAEPVRVQLEAVRADGRRLRDEDGKVAKRFLKGHRMRGTAWQHNLTEAPSEWVVAEGAVNAMLAAQRWGASRAVALGGKYFTSIGFTTPLPDRLVLLADPDLPSREQVRDSAQRIADITERTIEIWEPPWDCENDRLGWDYADWINHQHASQPRKRSEL